MKKTLQLIQKSNTTPFEWLQSPIIYQQQTQLSQQLWQLCAQYFNPRGNVHHYLGIATSAKQNLNGRQIKIKKLFYILRPLLCALWCIHHNQIAPMTTTSLMQLLTPALQQEINNLIEYKSTVAESQQIEISTTLHDFINTTSHLIKTQAVQLPELHFNTIELNKFFINILKNSAHNEYK